MRAGRHCGGKTCFLRGNFLIALTIGPPPPLACRSALRRQNFFLSRRVEIFSLCARFLRSAMPFHPHASPLVPPFLSVACHRVPKGFFRSASYWPSAPTPSPCLRAGRRNYLQLHVSSRAARPNLRLPLPSLACRTAKTSASPLPLSFRGVILVTRGGAMTAHAQDLSYANIKRISKKRAERN